MCLDDTLRKLRKFREVSRSFFQEGIAAFNGFVCTVGQTSGLSSVHLLTDQSVVDQVKPKLQHLNGRRALGHDFLRPVVSGPQNIDSMMI